MHNQLLNLRVLGKLTFFILYERACDFDLRKGRLATALAVIRKWRSRKLQNQRRKPTLGGNLQFGVMSHNATFGQSKELTSKISAYGTTPEESAESISFRNNVSKIPPLAALY
jgi:hypothetical protein